MYYEEVEDLVSIIIPVYNVSPYLDKCIESVVNQSYANIEILLLNDGSTDDSGEKCFEWSKRDNRIVFVSKKNEHQGPTRNLALQMAKGKYVVFIDPDDYISKDHIIDLYSEIHKQDADFVFCNIVEVVNGKENVLLSNVNIDKVTSVYKEPYIMNNIFLGICGKIYRKGLFLENDIKMSPYVLEDFEKFPSIFLASKKIGYVKSASYYYVKDRNGNTCSVNSNAQAQRYGKIIDNVMGNLRQNNKFYNMKKIIKNYLIIGFLVAFYGGNKRGKLKGNITEELLADTKNKMSQYFPDWDKELEQYFVCIGNPSVKARISAFNAYSKYYSNEFVDMYSFSSLISMFAPQIDFDTENIQLSNAFREQMVVKDFKKDLVYKSDKIFNGKDFVIINLLEERFDVIKYENTYLTKTGEFDKTDFAKTAKYEILKRDSNEVYDLFKISCEQLVEILKKYFKKEQVIIIREYVFEDMMDYDCSCSVSRMNEILYEYYSCLEGLIEKNW